MNLIQTTIFYALVIGIFIYILITLYNQLPKDTKEWIKQKFKK